MQPPSSILIAPSSFILLGEICMCVCHVPDSRTHHISFLSLVLQSQNLIAFFKESIFGRSGPVICSRHLLGATERKLYRCFLANLVPSSVRQASLADALNSLRIDVYRMTLFPSSGIDFLTVGCSKSGWIRSSSGSQVHLFRMYFSGISYTSIWSITHSTCAHSSPSRSNFQNSALIWKKYVYFLKTIRDLEKSLRIWKVYSNFKKYTDIKKLREFEWDRSKPGWVSTKPVKTKTRDEPCPVSVVGGASCSVLKLRDQI